MPYPYHTSTLEGALWVHAIVDALPPLTPPRAVIRNVRAQLSSFTRSRSHRRALRGIYREALAQHERNFRFFTTP